MTKKKGQIRLTDKQRAFVEAYLETWNGTEAARLAKYKGNDVTLASVAYENLRKPHIWAYIDQRMSEMMMSANEVLFRLGQQARSTIGDFLDDKGSLDIKQVKKYGHLVKSLTWNQYGPRIELHDNQAALVHIGRHFRLFTDRIELSWEEEILNLLFKGRITPQDIADELGPDLAQELFESAGLSYAGIGAAEAEGQPEDSGEA